MKPLAKFGSLFLCLVLVSCDYKARSLARQATVVLQQRSVELSNAIAAEIEAYNDYSVEWVREERDLTNSSLANERSERVNELKVEYLQNGNGGKPVSLWRKDLSDYAQIDYLARRNLLASDLNASTLYLQRLETLKEDQDKAEALAKLLATLAKQPSAKDELTAVTDFAQEAKNSFDGKVCADLKTKSDAGNASALKLSKDKGCKQPSK